MYVSYQSMNSPATIMSKLVRVVLGQCRHQESYRTPRQKPIPATAAEIPRIHVYSATPQQGGDAGGSSTASVVAVARGWEAEAASFISGGRGAV